MYLSVFFTIVSIILLRFVLYLDKLIRIKRYLEAYKNYLRNPTFEFAQKKPQIIQLFKDAGLKDFVISRLEPAGFGHLRTLAVSGFENIALREADVVDGIRSRFNEAIGIFRHRMLQSINPLFWLEMIFKLPQHIFAFVGVLPDKLVVKIALIIYWLVALLLGLKKFNILEELLK